MSPLVLLGTVGTLVSTITIIPHVLHATRTKQPGGSPLAWVMGTAGSTIWLLYGLASGDLLVAARKGVVYYDGRSTGGAAGSMIGQHGSWSSEETQVPLRRFGAFAR